MWMMFGLSTRLVVHLSLRSLGRRRCHGHALLGEAFRSSLLRRYLDHLVDPAYSASFTDERLTVATKLALALRDKELELRETTELTRDSEAEMRKLAEEECEVHEAVLQDLQEQLWEVILPEEKGDEDNAMLEVEAGVGGQEAMLFTSKVFHMYEKYAAYRNWTFNILEYNTTELGGMRLATASVVGPGSYKLLKYEGGVHRVQRVPQTERHGRVHTSTMSVAILPQPSEIKLHIDPKDLRIETKRSSGPGGQHVNTTESAVRITHLPSGFVCESQRDRSQLRNRDYAMAALRAKLYGQLLHQEQSALQSARKLQVGSRSRSEKIRTYNFLQDRVTDHRIGCSLQGLASFMSGDRRLDDMMEALRRFAEWEALQELLEKNPVSVK
uniref:peptide chain release factor 1-like, mitochondrial isoform X1 n=1 Tax=Myxine glutinosa TaxID=7769 RepID=UPI00358EF18A